MQSQSNAGGEIRPPEALAMPPCYVLACLLIFGEIQVYLPVLSIDFSPRTTPVSRRDPPFLLLGTRYNVLVDCSVHSMTIEKPGSCKEAW